MSTKPSLRRKVLVRSVQKLLDSDEQVSDVVMLWTRHRWFLPYSICAALALYIVATASGFESTANRLVLAGCGLAIAGIATTNYWVLAQTTRGLVLLRSSRIRHYAKAIERRLEPDAPIEMIGSTVITSDWRVDGLIYSLTKQWEATMRNMTQ